MLRQRPQRVAPQATADSLIRDIAGPRQRPQRDPMAGRLRRDVTPTVLLPSGDPRHELDLGGLFGQQNFETSEERINRLSAERAFNPQPEPTREQALDLARAPGSLRPGQLRMGRRGRRVNAGDLSPDRLSNTLRSRIGEQPGKRGVQRQHSGGSGAENAIQALGPDKPRAALKRDPRDVRQVGSLQRGGDQPELAERDLIEGDVQRTRRGSVRGQIGRGRPIRGFRGGRLGQIGAALVPTG